MAHFDEGGWILLAIGVAGLLAGLALGRGLLIAGGLFLAAGALGQLIDRR